MRFITIRSKKKKKKRKKKNYVNLSDGIATIVQDDIVNSDDNVMSR